MRKNMLKFLTIAAGAAGLALNYVLTKLIMTWIMPPAYPEYYTFWDVGDTVWTIAFAFGGSIVGVFLWGTVVSDRVQRQFDTLGSYYVSDKSLRILNRSPSFKDFVAVEPVLFLDHSYNEPTLVYTGATMGGVSMGGFHVQGGDYNAHVSRSGKFRLVHIDPKTNERSPIEKIILPPHLVKAAQSDTVLNTFLHSDTLILFYNVELNQSMSELAQHSVASGNMAMALSAAQRAHSDKQLSKEDCNYIKKWLLQK